MELQCYFLIIIQYRYKNRFLTKDLITNLQAIVAQELFKALLSICMVIIKEKNIPYYQHCHLPTTH